jgi:hypothetical protein
LPCRYRSIVRAARCLPVLAGLTIVGLGWPGASLAAPDQVAPPEQMTLLLQPISPDEGYSWDSAALEDLAHAAGDWLAAASSRRLVASGVDVRPPVVAQGPTCRQFSQRVAALRQQQRDMTQARWIYVGQARDCPYVGQAPSPGDWIALPSVGLVPQRSARTLVHEFGHTLGVLHAAAERCPVLLDALPDGDEDCGLDPYGDRTDPMGRGSLNWGLGPWSLAALGWGDGMVEVSGDGRHEVSLAPVTDLGTPDAAVVTDPVNGERYAIAYRAPGGELDTGLSEHEQGVYLYRLPHSNAQGIGSILLPWAPSLTSPLGGKPGFHIIAPGGGLAIRVESISDGAAQVTIDMDPSGGLRDESGPVFIKEQASLHRNNGTWSLRVPRAFDQSGVVRYSVSVNGDVVRRMSAASGLRGWTVALPQVSARDLVSVRVVDGNGNSTVQTLVARR